MLSGTLLTLLRDIIEIDLPLHTSTLMIRMWVHPRDMLRIDYCRNLRSRLLGTLLLHDHCRILPPAPKPLDDCSHNEQPERGLFVLCFVMIEVCGGRGGVTKACRQRGMFCGPVIELALGYDVFDATLFDWLLRLSLSGRVFCILLEPPCTSFSLARKPQMRDSHFPEGYDTADQRTHDGNMFALLCVLLCWAQWCVGNEFLLEQPAYGHMRMTAFWLFLWRLCGEVVITHV